MRLLLAEDERDMSAALVAILTHSGYDVDPVYDGEAAVEMAAHNTYDCMIFDIMMPKLDGVQALQQIRESGDVTPVIMLTAKAEVSDRITGLDAGADDYLTKPFAMAELLARIRAMTRRSTSFTPQKLQSGSVALNIEEQELRCTNLRPKKFSAAFGRKRKKTVKSSGFTYPICGKSCWPLMPIFRLMARKVVRSVW